jgi:YD repeat-containing protein
MPGGTRDSVRKGHEWKEYRLFDYDANANPAYIAAHETHDTATSSPGWFIWKLTYDANGNMVRKQGPLTGKADDRATLSW